MDSVNIRKWVFNHPGFIGFILRIINKLNIKNSIKLGGRKRSNCLHESVVLLKNVKINIVGKNNHIYIDDYSRLYNCSFYIYGNDNKITIGKRCYLYDAHFYIEDSKNIITIGGHTSVDGKTNFASIEGKKITVGEDCMFSQNIYVRTGDAHNVLDMDGNRINESKDVQVGNHCWIGMNTIIMKGAEIGDSCILGAGTIVTKKFKENNCIIAGVPGKIVKKEINWSRERIPFVKMKEMDV